MIFTKVIDLTCLTDEEAKVYEKVERESEELARKISVELNNKYGTCVPTETLVVALAKIVSFQLANRATTPFELSELQGRMVMMLIHQSTDIYNNMVDEAAEDAKYLSSTSKEKMI